MVAPPSASPSVSSPAPEQLVEIVQHVEQQVRSVIVGQQDVVRHVLLALMSGGHVLLEGVPGLGKTSLVRAFADALELRFARIQFTPDLMPSDIVGTDILEEQPDGRRSFRFQPGPIFANLILADEINRATPKTQSALLEAMQERTVSVLGRTYAASKPFFVMATQNPIEMEGTYPLPEAQLDRFMFKLNVAFPSTDELVAIIDQTTGAEPKRPAKVADSAALLAINQLVRSVPAASHVTRYAAALVAATHPTDAQATDLVKRFVRFGASPRGAQALLLGARAMALLQGRFNAAIDDIRVVAPAALRHRILLNFEAQTEGVQTDQVVADVIQHLKTP